MKITPEIKAIQNAYMQARSENNRPEMSRLKAEAMALMNQGNSEKSSEGIWYCILDIAAGCRSELAAQLPGRVIYD